ncbi:MAG: PatB family C-S lyase [candidate division KSB1 bacterium]|nr:PatB family C-S lyase [candidate division KSB1 bacterium]
MDSSAFDQKINRNGTESLKWDRYKETDILPMWVADMDFKSPPRVIQSLVERAEHGVYGYTLPPLDLTAAIVQRMQQRYEWTIQPEWLVWLPGLVCGINAVCGSIGSPGDAVLSSIPIYPPFLSAPRNMDRQLQTFSMTKNRNRYEFDFDAMCDAISDKTRLFLHCHPHNPLGRAFDRKELTQTAQICIDHDLIICSDEIHCDLLLDSNRTHIPMASLSPEIADRTLTLMAPSKTFNLPGLGLSFAVISNPTLRKQFKQSIEGIVPHPNVFAYRGAMAAYEHGENWLRTLLTYLRINAQMVHNRINAMPGLSMTPVEATYLAWIDTRETGIKKPQAFFEQARVGLSDGMFFKGPGFVRLNFGCQRSRLKLALDRMQNALKHFE